MMFLTKVWVLYVYYYLVINKYYIILNYFYLSNSKTRFYIKSFIIKTIPIILFLLNLFVQFILNSNLLTEDQHKSHTDSVETKGV